MTVRQQNVWLRQVNTADFPRTGEHFQNANTTKKAWTNSFNGESNPYFLGQIYSHTDATTSATWSEEDYSSSAEAKLTIVDPVNKNYTYKYSTSGLIVPLVALPAYRPTTDADAKARIAFRNSVRKVQTAFQGGTFLGELREAVHGIRHPVKALRQGVDQLITASRKNAKQALRGHTSGRVSRVSVVHRAARDTWLEWSYDKRPLISDIASLAEAIIRAPADDVVVVRGMGNDRSQATAVGTFAGGYAPATIGYSIYFNVETSVRYLGGCRMVSESPRSNLLRKFGLDWSNVAPTAWELIPYSFLVDYFSNCGALIDAAATTNFSVCWGCRTVVQKSSGHLGDLKWNKPSDPNVKVVSSSVSGSSYVNFKRQGSRGRFNTPDVGVNLFDARARMPGVDSLKWLNIAALASGRFFR